MGSLFICLMLLCSILFISLWIVKIFISKNHDQLPPGRRGWPFLGETLDYMSTVHKGIPEKFVEDRKKKYSSQVFKTTLSGQPVVIFPGAEGNKFLFSNDKKLVRVWWPSAVDRVFATPKNINMGPVPEALRLRRMILTFLKPENLRKFVNPMDSIMKQRLQTELNTDDAELKVVSLARKFTISLACNLFFSTDDPGLIDDFTEQIEAITVGVNSTPVNFPGTSFRKAMKASRAMRAEMEKMVKQRKTEIQENCSSPPQDLISHMLTKSDENGQFLNESVVISQLLGTVMGSYASVYSTMTMVIMYLAELPDVYNNVLREQEEIVESKAANESLRFEDLGKMKYTWNVVCEVMRLMPTMGTFRETIMDFKYDGYLIPKGWKIYWIPSATHKSKEYFPDPNKFDPSRFEGSGQSPFTYVPFGGGSRICPGIEYARVTILVFIHNMVTRFRWEKLIPQEKLIYHPLTRPAHGLPIRLYPHKL